MTLQQLRYVTAIAETGTLRRCLRPSRMYLSARPARWRPSPPSRWMTWPHTRAFPMSRASTTPFIFPKKF